MNNESPPTLLDFNNTLRAIAEELFALVSAKLGPTARWERAVLDVRSPVDGATQIAKFRITHSDGATASARLPASVNALIRQVWEIKQTAFPQQWYGLKLSLLPTGECATNVDYDPACFDDPTFFDI